MIVKNLPLTLLKVVNKSGTGKTSGKPYDFHVATVIDEDANVFNFNVADELAQREGRDVLASLRNVEITAEVRFTPKGFDVQGSLQDLAISE